MKLDKICRVCISEKASLKPIFGACLANMLMTCASVQVYEGDGLPSQICTQCLQLLNRLYSFKQLCEKSDTTIRAYIHKISLQNVALTSQQQNLIEQVKGDEIFSNQVLQQSSIIFSEIFCDATTHSLVENFTNHSSSADISDHNTIEDLAETMQSLQTIAEQCLPETWENEPTLITTESGSEDTTCNSLSLVRLFKCQFCEECYRDEWDLAEHMKGHTGQAKHFCSLTNETVSSSSHLNIFSTETTQNMYERKKTFNCVVCGKEYHDSKLLKKHIKEDHDQSSGTERKHMCTICGKRYGLHKLLVMHMRSHTGERPLMCATCGKTFSLPSCLHKHRLVHNEEKRFKCSVCGKAFNQASNITVHMRTHTGEKPFVCSVCGKGCATNINLKIHMRIHTGDKPYSCTKCDSSFATSSQLKKHGRRHTNERPYKCWHCEKSFRVKDTRDAHIRCHTGERPYSCSLCPKRYTAASHLRVHIKTHIGEKKYVCTLCPKKFIDSRTLKNHTLTHSGQKPFLCKFCERGFTQSSSLNHHLRNCHAVT